VAVDARQREFKPLQELAGISAVELNVDGLPNPVGDTSITEVTLSEDIRGNLTKAGITVVAPGDVGEVPTLHVRVLAILQDGRYFYTISVELEERCTPARNTSLSIPWCTTWSFYPRVGTFTVERGEVLRHQVIQAVDQFIKAWGYDNKDNEP
jgi:hypothetical protein